MPFVRIKHPDVDGEGVVEQRALKHLQPKGWELVADATPQPASPAEPPVELEQPAKNSSTDEWRTYAVAQGMPYDDAIQMGRDELVAHYTTEES